MSEHYLGIIDSVSPHPCAHLLCQNDIRREIGVIRINSKGSKKRTIYAAFIDGATAEAFGYIDFASDDYLKGQFIGYVAGNGYICNKNSFSVAINYDHIFIAERIHESLARFWNQYGKLKDGHRCFKYEKHSRELVSMIQSEFLPCERLDAFHKNVDLSGKSLNWMVGFLDGLCASDGCYSGKTLRLSLVNRP